MTQMTQIQMFSRMPVLERSKITVWEGHLFKRYFFYGSFRYLSSFCRKVFSGAPVKCFPLYRSKYWDFVAFNSPLSERSKLTVWEQRLFKKKKRIDMEVLGMCLSYAKRYFQEHEFSAFLIMAQITQILLFSGMLILERSNITVWERHLF